MGLVIWITAPFSRIRNTSFGHKKNQHDATHNLKNLYLDPIHEIKKHIFNKIKKIKNKFNKLILKGRYINEV